ncbi:MAG TPA: hypothetical protein VHR45_17595 [Thermoanaerobaculia bacterium]|nr:hypothetical protein [Thermoanaerobaculia bacterium]
MHLDRNLSGRAAYRLTIDMEPVVDVNAAAAHAKSGKPGTATAQEIAQAREQALRELAGGASGADAAKLADPAAKKASFAANLPPGIKLLSWSEDTLRLKRESRFEVGFGDLRQLVPLKLLPWNRGGSVLQRDQPFEGLRVVDEGPTVLVTLTPQPAGAGEERTEPRPAGEVKEEETILRHAGFAFRLDSPFEVVETNAARRDGHALYWEFKGSALVAAMNAQPPTTLRARLKK